MDIIDATALDFSCNVCGGRRYVTLRQMQSSQTELKPGEGCADPGEGERECPALYYGGLVDAALLADLEQVWKRLEERAATVGASVTLQGSQPVEQTPPKVLHLP